MKKLFITLILDFILIITNIAEIIHQGFFRDLYPNITITSDLTYFFWVSLALTSIIFILLIIILLKTTNKNRKTIFTSLALVALLILAITNTYYGKQYYTLTQNNSIKEYDEQDYISSEFYCGISLDELLLDINSEEQVMIYIGREDCNECLKFETKFEKILKEYHTELPTYYTTQDRDGNRSKEMYDLLDKYHIESVPTVIIIQNSKLIKIWNDPINHLKEIKSYL